MAFERTKKIAWIKLLKHQKAEGPTIAMHHSTGADKYALCQEWFDPIDDVSEWRELDVLESPIAIKPLEAEEETISVTAKPVKKRKKKDE